MPEARQMLRTLLEGRLIFTPAQNGDASVYEFSGQVALGRLLSGVVLPKGVVAPTGSDRFRLTVPIRGVLRLAA